MKTSGRRLQKVADPCGMLEINPNMLLAHSTVSHLILYGQKTCGGHAAGAESPALLSELVYSGLVSVGGEVGCVIKG